jgi:ribosomal protein S18 acetylase RimI-like enzyme
VGVRHLSFGEETFRIDDVPPEERAGLDSLLEESFEGWYLRHSKRILADIETVRVGREGNRPVGLVMLTTLAEGVGYVYYIAVARDFRRKKIGSRLLDHSLEYFSGLGMREVYASIEEDNIESAGLFKSRGFEKTGYSALAKKYGMLGAINMYRKMVVVPGEILLCRPMTQASTF